MSILDSKGRVPQDIVAIFHASFHPTKGNVVDWSLKASDDLSLDSIEFSALPSGLHLVEQDVVYFTKDSHRGVCIFRRRATSEDGHRGFRLSSLGILLAKSTRPRPWRHIAALKELTTTIYSALESGGGLEPSERDLELARVFFEERQVRRADLGGAGDWNGWSHELDAPETDPSESNPTLHLAHLLRILGPSALTLYKHILGRRRILIYTLPPVEAACILCQVAADMCYETQINFHSPSTVGEENDGPPRLKSKCKEGIQNLGMVTLSDLDKMHSEGRTGRGWIACTTDAIFLEKPSFYDLVVDLTTSTPLKATRPTLSISRPLQQPPGSRGPSHKLSIVRFTWSDVKLWTEVDRLLQRDAGEHGECCSPSGGMSDAKSKLVSTWTDAWRVYEDVCIICAGLWMGTWRGNSTMSYSTGGDGNWGQVRLDGDDDLTVDGYVRNVGMGIEGRPTQNGKREGIASGSASTSGTMRRTSAMSWSGGNAVAASRQASTSSTPPAATDEADISLEERRDRQVLTTLALLQTFHANTRFQLSRLATLLQRAPPDASAIVDAPVMLTPKDVMSFELGPFSSLDARYLEWLGDEYGDGRRVMVKRGWKDWFGMLLGFG